MSSVLEDLKLRVWAIIGRGRVKFVDDSGPVQKMQVLMNGIETPDNRYRVPEFGFTSNPPIDSDVIAAHVAGDRSAGAVLGTNHQPSRPKGLQPGETMLYSQDGKSVYLTASGGIVVEAKGQPVTVNDASNVTVNCSGVFKIVAPGGIQFVAPTVTSTGDMQDNVNTNPHSMAQMRTIYNGHKHPVENVQGGSSTIVSDVPNSTE
ncbi:baseplate assembly protein [Paraburkholderia sp. PGU19]|uniref:phage baseplate assembly protein V n=1 Tax=Paraburkholderia sp. PGU19 TaxID=2735434 RepID=UPI0015D9E537|nr:phage baseplate assembly protein V [Paraburkholderia sp. PGU19]BCF96640.1 baseplate assembly protein [Paraburkholderia sp. PGU19]